MTDPTVSVVVPTYNRAPVLPRAVESVLGQTLADLELLVVDDASTDETESVLDAYDDERLQCHAFAENRGANAARNHGIEAATGEYVAFLDSDDAYAPRYLERCVDALAGASDHDVGCYASRVWYRDGERWNLTVADADVTHDDLRRKNVVGGFSNVVFRRETVERVGPLDERYESCQDYEFFLRALAPDGRLVAVPDAVVEYYVHDAGATRIGDDLAATVAGHERLLDEHGDTLATAGVANQYYQLGMAHARAGDAATARRWFRRGIATDPRSWRHWYHYLASLGGLGALRAAVGLKIGVKRRVYDLRHDPGESE
jgi:glycosyltransferase involved in cell wall biosynthesis